MSKLSFVLLLQLSTTIASANMVVNPPTTAVLHDPKLTPTSVPDAIGAIPAEPHPEAYYFTSSGKEIRYQVRKNVYLLTPAATRAKGPPVDLPKLVKALEKAHGKKIKVQQDNQFRRLIRVSLREGRDTQGVLTSLRTRRDISYISPVLQNRSGIELGLSPEVVVRMAKAGQPSGPIIAEFAKNGLHLKRALSFTDYEFLFEFRGLIEDPADIFQTVRQIMDHPEVEWAEPNFLATLVKQFTPDDTLYPDQWHLNNTGQNAGQIDADVDGPEGWELSRGAGSIIAIYDDGVQLDHPDLPVWNNPGESGGGKESNGVDDDGNGYVDDYQGWDFSENDNNPNPSGANDNHGTSVAGVAGAQGNNSVGVTGSATNAQILAVRMTSGACSDFANAMRYAAKYADVITNSWGIDACESNIDSAITEAVSGSIEGSRRGDKGTPVLFATGNKASGWVRYFYYVDTEGSHEFQWMFTKDASVSEGYDTIWIDDISWPDGSVTDFEGSTSLPPGFSTESSPSRQWTIASDGIHARGASGNSAKAAAIGNSQTSSLYATKIVSTGWMSFWHWVSAQNSYDGMIFYVDGNYVTSFTPGQYSTHQNEVGYPASNPDAIAIGASNNGYASGNEERSYYSQFGTDLDVVAPSSGYYVGVTTADRTGADGYDSADYTSGFGGTSSATPLAAGVVADIIGLYPHITAAQVRDALRGGADQIGPYPYISERNDYYGHGRVNLLGSLQWVTANNLAFDCDYEDILIADRWALIGLPCDAISPSTVTSIFGDDLDITEYGSSSDWIIGEKRFAGANNYDALVTSSVMEPGRGYWIKSYTGNAFEDGGALDAAGIATPVAPILDIPECPSDNGCFVIDLNPPEGIDTYEWNMVAHPFAYPVDWAETRIVLEGTPNNVYTPYGAEVDNIVSATYQAWNGNGYDPYDDGTIGMEGVLQPGQGIWVKALSGSKGEIIKLLIPAVPTLNTSQLFEEEGLPWYTQVLNWIIPAAQADDSAKKYNPGRREQAIGFEERETQKAIIQKRLEKGDDWYVRLSVEVVEEQLKDVGNVFGQLVDSQSGYDRHDLKERSPFAAPYLTLVFPHDDWGEQSGNYASDFHGPGRRDQWLLEIHTDSIGREVNLCWDGPASVIAGSVLVDLSTKQRYRLKRESEVDNCLPIFMEDTTKQFSWNYTKRKK